MPCRMFESIPGLYLLDARALSPQVVTTQKSPDIVKYPLRAKFLPLENHWSAVSELVSYYYTKTSWQYQICKRKNTDIRNSNALHLLI